MPAPAKAHVMSRRGSLSVDLLHKPTGIRRVTPRCWFVRMGKPTPLSNDELARLQCRSETARFAAVLGSP